MLEVKGDFCGQVRNILARAGRADDYIEVGLDTDVCYNPLHNDLDPYAVAYAIATLLNNLFGKSKEPFWQQAYTDLLKFVIALRRITDGYTTLAEVYRYIINESDIDKNIRELKARFKDPPEVIAVPAREHDAQLRQAPWTLWSALGPTHVAHPYDAELEGFLAGHGIPFDVRTGTDAICAERRHRLEAINRWFYGTWAKLDGKLKASIVEGVVVFLSLFDENPAVYRAFCPSRATYAAPPTPGQPRPLPPLEDLLESGHVLGLNFPVALNPALARGLGVMLKLDFQRAVLQRIPKISANPAAVWRDLLFVADEYHAFATVGETDPTGDERAFALSRQARLIPIVATQSISSLRSALPGDESWRTLLQCFRTKLFLATSDEFTAKIAAELCGRADRLKAKYSLSEAGQDTHISLLTGRAAAAKQTVSASKTYTLGVRLRLPAPGLHRVAERASGGLALRRVQPVAAAALLPEAVLPGRADQLLRPPGTRGVVSSLDRILPFLRPIEDLLVDPTVTEVMVNDGGRRVFVERAGILEPVAGRTLEPRNLTVAIKNIARACGDEISDVQPLLDARLEDGSRVAAMFPPCAVAGPALTIRKFTRRYSLDDLVDVGTLTQTVARQLSDAIATQQNVLISGGTGTGKTTLLNALAAHIPDADRVIVIEETAEIHLDKPNALRLEARRAQAPLGQEAPLPPVTICGPASGVASPSPRPHHPRRGARGGSVRPSAGTQHRPLGQPQHHPRELRRAGVHAIGALRAHRERRAPASQHA